MTSDLLPHAGAMVFVDSYELIDPARIHCKAVVRADNPLLLNGTLPPTALLEFLAQAAGVLLGLGAHERGETRGGGRLISARKLDLHASALPVGSELDIHVEHRAGNDGLEQFAGTVNAAGKTRAEAIFCVLRTQAKA